MNSFKLFASELNNRRLLLYVILAVVFLSFQQTFYSILQLWLIPTGTYGHGLLILFISIYLLYQQRLSLMSTQTKSVYLAIIPVLIFSLLYLSGIDSIRQLSIPALLIFIFLYLYGFKFALKVAPAILFLYLALPGWGVLVPYLQDMTVYVVKSLLSMLSIPAYVYNVYVELPFGTFEIAEGCSGLRYFVVGVALSILYSVTSYTKLKSRFIFILSGIAISIIANWLRVFIIIVAGYQTKMQHSLVVDGHYYFGWGVYMVMMTPLIILAVRSSRTKTKSESHSESNVHLNDARVLIDRKTLISFVAVVVVVISVPVLENLQIRNTNEKLGLKLELNEIVDEYRLSKMSRLDWEPSTYGSIYSNYYQYSSGRNEYDILISFYSNNTQAIDIANKYNQLESDNWKVVKRGKARDLPANQLVMQSKLGKQKLVYYWYNINGFLVRNKHVARLVQSLHKIFGIGQSAVFFVSVDCPFMCSDDEMNYKILNHVMFTDLI